MKALFHSSEKAQSREQALGCRALLTRQLQASVCAAESAGGAQLWTVAQHQLKGVGLPVQHRQAQSEPLCVGLSSEAHGHTGTEFTPIFGGTRVN